jgi:hypothetical protein
VDGCKLLPSSGRLKLRGSKVQHADIQRFSGGATYAYLFKSYDLQLVSTECYCI